MKIKFKMSLLVITIQIAVIFALSAIMLTHAAKAQMETSREKQAFLAKYQSAIIQDRYNGYMRVIKTLAGIFSEYEMVDRELRRPRFRGNIEAVLNSEPNMVGIFSVWKPNILDDDADYIGDEGAAPNGQFAPFYHQYTGKTVHTFYQGYAEAVKNLSANQTVSGPFPQVINGKDALVIVFTSPVLNYRTHEPIGVVGVVIDIFALEEVIKNTVMSNSDIRYMAVYTNNGDIIGSYHPEQVGKNIRDGDRMLFAKHMDAVASAVKNGRLLTVEEHSSVLNTELTITVAPFTIGLTAHSPWAVGVGTPNSRILKDVRSLTGFTVIMAGTALIVMAVIIFLTMSRITKPIVCLAETLKDISQGEGDLTKTLSARTKDEIGDLAHYFNLTLEKIRNLVISIKRQSTALFEIGGSLASNMTESAASINQITLNIRSIKSQVINQSAGVTETNATMKQITSNINKLNSHVAQQTESVAQSSSSIEEMIANIQSVTQTLVRNAENVEELIEASEAGKKGLLEVSEDIQEIAKDSEGLLEINKVMENIASQTNLLSMNAAIEAAHAGEAGKGFAVVAGEIRKLAVSSSEQSKTISAVLKKIKISIDKITDSTDNVLNKFEAIDNSVRTVSKQESNIRSSMEEQGHGSKQILEAIDSLNDLTSRVKNGSEEMLHGSQEIILESRNLEKVTIEITNSMNEMSSGADQINASVSRVSELCGENRDTINTLVREVSRFKVE
ncbi:MAG: methyl-accepting chemotaxis protein [Spirochaetaceae bacterium]|jgi:methyl-accepting chemotaxis protein|nr:methyl-accepting chemotaxis protein [Spirochaetaceae bacterium]